MNVLSDYYRQRAQVATTIAEKGDCVVLWAKAIDMWDKATKHSSDFSIAIKVSLFNFKLKKWIFKHPTQRTKLLNLIK